MAYFRELSSSSSSLCVLFSSFFSSLFSSRGTFVLTKISAVFLQPHLLHREGEQQWPKHLTEADFRAVLAAAVTVAIEEVAAVTAAAEVAAAEVAGEGKRTRTSGPRARSWGDWCKRYAFVIIRCFCRREGMCARGMDASLSRKCFATSRRRLRRALEVATPSSRAISVPLFFVFRIDFGPTGGLFWGSTSLSTCRSAHVHANGMCSPMSLLFVVEFIQGKIKSLEQIYLHSIPIKEYQIVDYFVGANLVDEVMKIMPVQKQTSAGNRMRFKAFVVVGDSNGHIGLGVKACKEVAHSIQGSMILAKLNMVPVRRGYWGAALGAPHTVPTKVHGKCGSVHIRLIPAPKGTGVVAAQTPKKVLVMAGIHDVFTCSRGHTRTLGNFVKATYFALRSTYEFLTPDLWAENKWQKAPEQEYTDFLSAPPKKVRQYEEY